MNFINFIDYLIDTVKLDNLLIEMNVDRESEALIACLKESLDINSEVSIFGIEETDGKLIFEKSGTKFIELFPLEMLQEITIDYVNAYKNLSHYEIAKKIMDYRINDA
ncbi:hypothetical protein QE422_001883 [Chryseobacterium sp. SORGH_AS 447]|uniref:hypothetical protein n=1 Tax=Chryseobacterium sp. SORGH_AS_0447 TaxID=3041769 RepID=UPI0027801E14|nr:hypothetical protein [Chryseobacterium sp. SORGH_AS_0447]MDQ1161515.1 hypothetical protein [Chryseobacterium sp. SORGH_AS_0447]